MLYLFKTNYRDAGWTINDFFHIDCDVLIRRLKRRDVSNIEDGTSSASAVMIMGCVRVLSGLLRRLYLLGFLSQIRGVGIHP